MENLIPLISPYLFLVPAVISLVNRVSSDLAISVPWQKWLLALVLGEVSVFGTAYLLSVATASAMTTWPILLIIGVVVGLGSSGLVDLSQVVATRRDVE